MRVLHVLDHSAMGAPAVPEALKAALRAAFKGTFILAGGFDAVSAEAALKTQIVRNFPRTISSRPAGEISSVSTYRSKTDSFFAPSAGSIAKPSRSACR